MVSILSALASLHAAGLAHGDLRPANVLYRLNMKRGAVAPPGGVAPDILLTDVGPLPAKCDASRTDYYHAAFTWLQFTCRSDARRPPPMIMRAAFESDNHGGSPRAQLDSFERAMIGWCPALKAVVYRGNASAAPTTALGDGDGDGDGWNEIERRGAALAWGMLLVEWPAVLTIFEGKAGCVHGRAGPSKGPTNLVTTGLPAESTSKVTQRAISSAIGKWSELCRGVRAGMSIDTVDTG